MKRFYALLLSVILIVTLSLSAFASTSPKAPAAPEVKTDAPYVPSTTPAPVTAVSIAVADVSTVAASSTLADHAKDLLANKDDFLTTYAIPEAARLAAVFNMNFSGEIPGGGLQVPIVVNNAVAGDYVIVMHRKADGIWEVVGRGILGDDLTVVATFTSFSPVMVLVVDAADVAAVGIKAPKTGE
ncbi:MAG: hypothetical protein FWE14_05010 [Lachnospiraceae bacterium]|nr:hypothetical protein [Lachnospiraceae bacterium]